MSELQRFTPQDRVLVIAPHPDDEAIATSGVLQVAHAAGAACRVLVITDGDNNPWPQRWIEKRWHIGADARARWGAGRRAEAMAALRVLGLHADDVRCFGFPDLGLTDLLMNADIGLETALAGQLDEFRPTCLFLPALDDRHPDHSALHVLLRLALRKRGGPTPQLYTFGVHGETAAADDVVLTLSESQREIKRAAIMSHTTQMRLSRRRFVAYARAIEPFRMAATPGVADPQHPVQATVRADGTMQVRIDHARWGRGMRGQMLFGVVQYAQGETRRWRVMLSGGGLADVLDTVARGSAGPARVARSAGETDISLTIGSAAACWIKLARPQPGLFVLDRCGWQTAAISDTRSWERN
ncbi:MAG TPA: PIG-L deacetylase family protein [Rudaea sp.]